MRYKISDYSINLKIYFFNSRSNYYPDNIGVVCAEEKEGFFKNVKISGYMECFHDNRLLLEATERRIGGPTERKS